MFIRIYWYTDIYINIPWKRAYWSSSPFGSLWTLSGPHRESPGRSHWFPGSLLVRKPKYFPNFTFCKEMSCGVSFWSKEWWMFTRGTVGLIQSLFLLCYPPCGVVHPVSFHAGMRMALKLQNGRTDSFIVWVVQWRYKILRISRSRNIIITRY